MCHAKYFYRQLLQWRNAKPNAVLSYLEVIWRRANNQPDAYANADTNPYAYAYADADPYAYPAGGIS